MLFQTFTFLAFFAIFLLFYFFSRPLLIVQNSIILLGSYIFYGAWDERFLVLIIASTATDYLAGIGACGENPKKKSLILASAYLAVGSCLALSFTIDESKYFLFAVFALITLYWLIAKIGSYLSTIARKRLYLCFSIVVNLGLLGTFKYFDFFAESLQSLAALGGIQFDYVSLAIILPVGISFYTFQTLSYTIDIYRGRIKPTENFLELASFVAFFPQLVAGPIERAANLLPQFNQTRQINAEQIKTGVTLFVWGLFKKVFIADNLAPIADAAFANPGSYSSSVLLIGLLAFTFQIFCDFSGYSDMARGTARILGFNLMLNFNIPYISRSPSEFWQRWHISLSSWLRDYLYISLGGNRDSPSKTYRNLIVTMLLGGLWHGASWTFVLWGSFHGLILVAYRILRIDDRLVLLDQMRNTVVRYFISFSAASVMFFLTLYGWLIFRANEMGILRDYSNGLFAFNGSMDWVGLGALAYFVTPLIVVQFIQIRYRSLEVFWILPLFVRWNIALFVVYAIIFLQPRATSAFIYFDF